MPLSSIATAAQLAGTVVLALFFILLARHDRRPYLREWTYAWVAQVAALTVVLLDDGRPAWPGLYVVLTTFHGVFLCAAAQRYARRTGFGRRFYAIVLSLSAVALSTGWLFTNRRPLDAAIAALLAATHGLATWLLWPRRDPTAMGLRLVTNLLLILAIRHGVHAVIDSSGLSDTPGWLDYGAVAPFTTLMLQMLLALGMVLAAMEAGQRRLAEANAKLEEAQRRLKMLADTDPMTGCFNRRVFRDLVDEFRADPARRAGTLLVLDMDGLKRINDTQGHSAGDQAIRRTADAIRAHTREGDLVLRWGGDEFVVILPGVPYDDGLRRGEAITESIGALGLGASVGSSAYGVECDLVIALRDADRQMYTAKASRKAQAATAS